MLDVVRSPRQWSVDASRDVWFRRRPRLALGVATALFVAVFMLRVLFGDPVDAYSMFYVLPVGLMAVAFGLRGGVAAGLLACALMAIWAVTKDVSLGPTGWLARFFPMLLLGSLLGHAADRLRRGEAERRRLEAAALLHQEAIEINDSLVQGMAAAKWSLEAGRTESGLQTLDETIGEAQRLVSGLIRRADMAQSSEMRLPGPTVTGGPVDDIASESQKT